jgi:hypothetical protein
MIKNSDAKWIYQWPRFTGEASRGTVNRLRFQLANVASAFRLPGG